MKNNSTAKNLFWKLSEKMGSQIINFIITIVLARILGPSEYGVVALISIFITFATVMVQDGFNVTLIRRKDIDDDEFKSSLYFSLLISAILYIVLVFWLAPLIGKFYEIHNLVKMLQVLSLVIFPAAINSIQTAFSTKKFMFKQMFLCNFFATLFSGAISIILAYYGIGAWALVFNQLLYQMLSCAFLWIFCKWRPKGKFSYVKLKKLIGFGSKMLFTSLLINLFLNIRSLLIGKFYSSKDLGFFNRGKSFSSTMMEGINGSIQSVLLPTYAKIQDNIVELKNSVRKSINMSCYIIFPALIGLACVAEPLINILLGKEWVGAIPYVQIFALTYLFQPTQISTAQALKAIEKGNSILIIEILRKSLEMILLLFVLFKGPLYIALTGIIAGFLSITIMVIPNKKYLKYSYKEQIFDFIKPLADSLIMGALIVVVNHILKLNYVIMLIMDIILGIGVYLFLSIYLKNKNYIFFKENLIKYIYNLKTKKDNYM